MNRLFAFVAGCAVAIGTGAFAQTKWDMPTPYAATNFHTENVMQFAADVDKATGGKLKIQVHPNASLFKANEIKRAVQGGQAQIGEILLSGYSNEDPLFGLDSVPFLATSYGDAEKLWKASKKAIEDKFARQGMMILYSVPWPPQGIYSSKPINAIGDMKGLKMRTYNPYTSRIAELAGGAARHHPGGGAGPGVRHRRRQRQHHLRRDRLRHQGLGGREELLRHAGVVAEERGVREQGRLRRARQGHPGGGDEGRGRRRGARLEDLAGEDRVVRGAAAEERHDRGATLGAAQGRLQKIGETMTEEWLRPPGRTARRSSTL
jgi:hypothetical protein